MTLPLIAVHYLASKLRSSRRRKTELKSTIMNHLLNSTSPLSRHHVTSQAEQRFESK